MSKALLTIDRIQDVASLEIIKEDWNALLRKSEVKTVELTYEWQITYWQHFNTDAELFVLVIRESGAIVAIAPLKLVSIKIFGVKIRRLEIIAAQESNYQDLIVGENTERILKCFLHHLIESRETWDILSLDHIPETSPTVHFILERLTGYPLFKTTKSEKCIFLQLNTSWDEHKKSLGKNRRHRMANRMTRIERDIGEIHLRNCSTVDQFRSDLRIFFNLHRKRWNQTDTPSQFLDNRYCEFYSDVGLQLLTKGQLGLSALKAGEIIVAQLLFFNLNKNSLIQLIAYDPDYYQYSPMLVLQELFVEKSLSSGAEVIDWGTYYPWKELWANRLKNRVNVRVFPSRLLPYSVYLLSRIYQGILTGLEHTPRILDLIRHLWARIRLLTLNIRNHTGV